MLLFSRANKKSLFLITFFLSYLQLSSLVCGANCPDDDLQIKEDTVLPGNLFCNIKDEGVVGVLSIGSSDITLDCNGTVLNGTGIERPNVFKFGVFNPGHNNVTVKNCIIQNYGDGILFINSSYGKLVNNTLISNDNGIVIDRSAYTEVFNNTVVSNTRGILLLPSSYQNIIFNNNIASNKDGIQIEGSYNNTIFYNIFNSNERAIWLRVGPNYFNNFYNNTFRDNEENLVSYSLPSFPVRFYLDPDFQLIVVKGGDQVVMDKILTSGDIIELEKENYTFTFSKEGYETSVINVALEKNETINSFLYEMGERQIEREQIQEEREQIQDRTQNREYLPTFLLLLSLVIFLIFVRFMIRKF